MTTNIFSIEDSIKDSIKIQLYSENKNKNNGSIFKKSYKISIRCKFI